MMSPRPLTILLVLLAVTLAGCGADGGGSDTVGPAPDSEREDPGHAHGLGVDPGDGTLYIATHNGLFTAAAGEREVQRVSEHRQDIMGLSVVGEEHLVGSGHPSPQQDLPPHLGLIESRDGGRTWDNVSLLGDADFHVLRTQGERVYGFDGTQGRLMVSHDGGSNWRQQPPPAAMYDLAIHPEDDSRVIASTERGLYESTNAGADWRLVDEAVAGLLAWPAGDRLYLIDGQGQIMRSADAGRRFEAAGKARGQPVAFTAHDGAIYVALADGSVHSSDDDGRTWTLRARP